MADEILTKLIEKYEDNKKRLVLKLDKDFIQYRNAEYYEREECNSVLNNLKELCFSFITYIIKVII